MLNLGAKLIPLIQQRFPDRHVTFGAPPKPIAVFAAAHPDVGDLQIFDDGAEVTIVAGKFTHGHFSDFSTRTDAEAEEYIVQSVIDFLYRMFGDQVVMWGSHASSGGWYDRGSDTVAFAHGNRYVWSGPLSGD